MELAELLHKYKNVGFNITLIILSVIIANNIHKTQVKEIESLIKKKEAQIKKNEILKNISGLEKKLSYYKSSFERKDTDFIIGSLSAIAKGSDIKIVSIKPTSEQHHSDYVKFFLELEIKASSYHAFGKFISEIENSQYIYIIDEMSIKFEENKNELSISLKLVYVVLN